MLVQHLVRISGLSQCSHCYDRLLGAGRMPIQLLDAQLKSGQSVRGKEVTKARKIVRTIDSVSVASSGLVSLHSTELHSLCSGGSHQGSHSGAASSYSDQLLYDGLVQGQPPWTSARVQKLETACLKLTGMVRILPTLSHSLQTDSAVTFRACTQPGRAQGAAAQKLAESV
eukprot:5722597-Amphidinium_carterae.6